MAKTYPRNRAKPTVVTPEMREDAVVLFNEGFSYSVIADRLGCTKNAVAGTIWRARAVGKVTRPEYRSPATDARRSAPARAPRPKAVSTAPTEGRSSAAPSMPPVPARPAIPVTQPPVDPALARAKPAATLSVLQLTEFTCVYTRDAWDEPDRPLGERVRFCGAWVAGDGFCAAHRAIALQLHGRAAG